ncbi:MAG TPA: hypothetical protein VFM23_07345 [Gemmatimonadales bacterium]|nr:hypothetical protein [Gemmatimonadales bacterium]
MHPLLALALLLAAGIGATYLSRPNIRFRHTALLKDLLATGALFLVLGLVLRRGLEVIDPAGWRDLQPVLALGIGWLGATFGARLEWRMIRRVSPRTWLVGATLALPVLVVTTVLAVILARKFPALADSWGRPTLAVALALGGTLTTAAGQRGPRLGRRNALIDTTFGVAAVAVALAIAHPQASVRNMVLTLVGGVALGGLYVVVARAKTDADDARIGFAAATLAGAGFSFAAGLSPFVVCAVQAAIVMSFSPPASRRAVAELLARWEVPLYAAFLILAGALLRPMTAWVILAAVVLALVRVVVRWVTVRFGLDQVDPVWRSLPFAPPREFAFSAMRQGATAVALAAGFELVRGGSGAVLVTILTSVMIGELLAVMTPLTASPRQAEVS